MAKIELSQLVSEMTPEQKIFVQWFYSQFDNNSAANRRIINVEPLFYQGVIAATEFLSYAATKLYLCLSIKLGSSTNAAAGLGTSNITFYNESNTATQAIKNQILYWDTVANLIGTNFLPVTHENFYFSRLVDGSGAYNYIKFNGYRITLV